MQPAVWCIIQLSMYQMFASTLIRVGCIVDAVGSLVTGDDDDDVMTVIVIRLFSAYLLWMRKGVPPRVPTAATMSEWVTGRPVAATSGCSVLARPTAGSFGRK
jgi:hypothetical protein